MIANRKNLAQDAVESTVAQVSGCGLKRGFRSCARHIQRPLQRKPKTLTPLTLRLKCLARTLDVDEPLVTRAGTGRYHHDSVGTSCSFTAKQTNEITRSEYL